MRHVFRVPAFQPALPSPKARRKTSDDEWAAASPPAAHSAFEPTHVAALQRALGNTATRDMLHANATGEAVQRAGDPEGMMKEHHASGFTYHHIIPENKLHDFWETLQEHGHTALIKTGLGSVVTRGLAQLREAGNTNIKRDLQKEISEVTGAWDDSKFAEITNEAIAGVSPDDLLKKHFPGLEDPTHKYHSSYIPIRTIFSKWFKVMNGTTGERVQNTVAADGDGFLAEEHDAEAVNKMLMWMPGNIHRGPNKRFIPGDAGFDANVDDGGKLFEEGAKQVVPGAQFAVVSRLNAAMDAYLANPDDPTPLALVATELAAMSAFNVTEYDPGNWVQVTEGKGKKAKTAWRLKKRV